MNKLTALLLSGLLLAVSTVHAQDAQGGAPGTTQSSAGAGHHSKFGQHKTTGKKQGHKSHGKKGKGHKSTKSGKK